MSKTFLITSHTEGLYPFEQKTLLHGLVASLKKYFPDCFIVVASQSEIDFDTQQIIDYAVVDKKTINIPHGTGEISLLRSGLNVLKQFDRQNFYKIVYDFVIDDTNYHVFDKWTSTGKDFVSSIWRTNGVGIGSWAWYSTTDFFSTIMDFNFLDMHLECKLLQSIQNKNLLDHCFFYDPHEKMFDNQWYDRCDLVHSGGTVLKHNYGSVVAAIDITDNNEYDALLAGHFVAAQEKKPNHVLFVDKRSNKDDLRAKKGFQDLFLTLSVQGISWNLIFYVDPNHTLRHLMDLGHSWCWLVKFNKFLCSQQLKTFYRQVILNYGLGVIVDSEQNIFYRNRIILPEDSNVDLNKFILDKMKETQYNSIVV